MVLICFTQKPDCYLLLQMGTVGLFRRDIRILSTCNPAFGELNVYIKFIFS